MPRAHGVATRVRLPVRVLGPRLGWLLTIAVGVIAGGAAVLLVVLIHVVERLVHTGGAGLEGPLRIAPSSSRPRPAASSRASSSATSCPRRRARAFLK